MSGASRSKLNLDIFHHISSACNSASVEAILYA